MDRRSELTSAAAPRTQRDLHLGSALGSNRTTPTDVSLEVEPATWGFTKRLGLVVGLRSLTRIRQNC